MRIVFCDHWYEEAFRDWKRKGGPKLHGTAQHWDDALTKAGHECTTIVKNEESDIIAKAQSMNPAVICSENIGLWNAAFLREKFPKAKIVGFCSYAASDENLRGWDVLFSSFAWRVTELRDAGVNAKYLPLAFGRGVLNYVKTDGPRDIAISAVCGAGDRIWEKGTETLAVVAEAFPDLFQWFGYGVGKVPEALQRCYRGPAWGIDYYRVLARSKITINRHGEIARAPNNMRMYEATGMGACLFTERFTADTKPGLEDFFAWGSECWSYGSEYPEGLVGEIKNVMDTTGCVENTAKRGQARTLRDHTYENRVDAFLEAIDAV